MVDNSSRAGATGQAARRGQTARLALVLAAACNGATYPILRLGVGGLSPALFVLLRFLLAAAVLLPWAWAGLRARAAMRSGAVLGLIEGSVGALVALNIGAMPASRCAFMMGVSVVLVPIWASLLRMQRWRAEDGLRSAISLSGLWVLTGAKLVHLGPAEAAVLLAAALWALNIVLVKRQTQRHQVAPSSLAFYQALCNAGVPLALCLTTPVRWAAPSPAALAALAYCALVATVGNLLIQARFQKHTSSTQAALRLSLEPVFATLLGSLAFGDAVTWATVAGGGLMLVATLLTELRQMGAALLRWRRG